MTLFDISRPAVGPRAHHTGRGFRNPWPGARPVGVGPLLRWMRQRVVGRLTGTLPPGRPHQPFPLAEPDLARPRASADECRVTWVGHATCLLQVGGLNVLTDPVWSARASPLRNVGPPRVTPPPFGLDALPPIDCVLLSHNHYDHFDADAIRALARRHPGARWLAPLGVGGALRALGAGEVAECDWWQSRDVALPGGMARVTATPAQHFSGRTPFDRDATLWCGWTLETGTNTPWRVYFAGDSGLHPEFARVGETLGPFDVVLMPIGAYAPRWIMRPVHMDPEEAVTAYAALGEPTAAFVPIHWGTIKLTDEALEEPPRRLAAAWAARGMPDALNWTLRHGETRMLRRDG